MHTFKVGDKVYVDNGSGCKGHGEIVCLLERSLECKEPSIVVKLKGLKGEYVQAVFEKDILPPPAIVVYERFHNLYACETLAPVSHDSYYSKDLALWHANYDRVGYAHVGFLRIYLLSDDTWHIEKVK